MFRFIVQYFGMLKHIPGVPHIYDALLKIHLFFTNRTVLDCIDDVEETVCTWNHVTLSVHKYGGIQFNLGTHEFGHLHGNGLLDVPLNRIIKDELAQCYPIEDHHVFKNSGWVSFWIKKSADKNLALLLLQRAYHFHANRSPF